MFVTVNPVDGSTTEVSPPFAAGELEEVLDQAARAAPGWQATPLAERTTLVRRAGQVLRARSEELAGMMTREMGKPILESRAEIEKCALGCDYYADHGADFLVDEIIASDAGRSFVACQPLGTVLAVMPWNFPFWQVFRFAAPALVAGNTGLLKHASNVPQCALAIESVFREAGFPAGVFRTLMIGSQEVAAVIADRRVHAVTLTGSEPAGRAVARAAGDVLKKCVLELGGSDPFIVLADADLDLAVANAVASRFINSGQSCIAAKRFIVVPSIADAFVARFRLAVEALAVGDPLDERNRVGPMARRDLREDLHRQVTDSIAQGAVAIIGCQPLDGPGAYYAPSILDHVEPGMRAYHEELFGPVASVLRARDTEDAVRIANDTEFGLGGSVWTRDHVLGEQVARRLQCGSAFVNGLVKSDPRLPFGGIRRSGFGRELSHHGMHEFVNFKTVWVK